MIKDRGYEQEMIKAKDNLSDFQEHETYAIGADALEFIDGFLTPDEIAESDLRAALIGELIKARKNSKN